MPDTNNPISRSDLSILNGYQSAAEIRDTLSSHIETMECLCAALEELADELPTHINKQRTLYIVRTLYPEVCRAHAYEETIVFPFLQNKLFGNSSMMDTIERLKGEHWEDESYALELHESLMDYLSETENRKTEQLGYMLRGFFEGMRRHIAFEREHILPMLSEIN